MREVDVGIGDEASRFDLDRGADGNQGPDFVDLFVGYGDAAVGPIVQAMRGADPAVLGAEAVDFDVATGADAELASVFPVLCIGLGEMKGAVEDTRGIFAVDDVESFGSFVIALALLRAHGLATEGDLVCSEHRTATHERERALALFDDDAIGLFGRRGSGANGEAREKKKNGGGQDAES